MAQQWFYAKQGKQQGPVPLEVLQKAVAGGEVSPTDLVWTEGMQHWTQAAQVKELAGSVVRTAGPPLPPGAKLRQTEPSGLPPMVARRPASAGLLSLCDLRFKQHFAPSLVKLIWLLYLIVAPLWFLIDLGIAAADLLFLRRVSAWVSLKWILLDLITFCFLTLAVRLILEATLLLLRVADHVRDIRDRGAGDSPTIV